MKTLIQMCFIFTFFLFFQGCQEEEPVLGSPHTITCAADTECVADESLGDEEDDKLLRSLFDEATAFFGGFKTHLFVLHEPSPAYANAFASRKDGHNYIYIGKEMFYQIKEERPHNLGISIMAIIVHEYAHIMQFSLSIDEDKIEVQRQVVNVGKSVVLSELEADAFSGYFIYDKLKSANAVMECLALLEALGDHEFESAQHHGTPEQRKQAAELGIEAARELEASGVTLSFRELRYRFLSDIESTILYDEDF